MKKPETILIDKVGRLALSGLKWKSLDDRKQRIIEAMKEYAKQWLDEAAEVAMNQCENGLPVGDAVYELKNLIDKQ